MEAGHTIYNEGDSFTKLIIIIEGEAIDEYADIIFETAKVFSEQYVYPKENLNTPLKGRFYMKSPGVISELECSKLWKILGGNLESVLIKNEKNHEKRMGVVDTLSHLLK